MRSVRSCLAGVLAACFVLSNAAFSADFVSLEQAVVRLGPPGPPSVVQLPENFSAKRRSATFAVTYVGFTPTAKAAFQRAVNIWATQITSPVVIRVRAQWSNLGTTGILGQAGPATFASCPSACPPRVVANTWYPIALFNKLYGSDRAPGVGDITAQFNSAFTNWYFGTGPLPANKIDFTSVVLHELGHGLGFLGSGRPVNATQGSLRSLGANRLTIYDRFTATSANAYLRTFPDPSATLKTLMTNNALFFRLPNGTRYRLFAPASFQLGSSYSHLNETTYVRGNPNSLMTPLIGAGEKIQSPGPATINIFKSMGWN